MKLTIEISYNTGNSYGVNATTQQIDTKDLCKMKDEGMNKEGKFTLSMEVHDNKFSVVMKDDVEYSVLLQKFINLSLALGYEEGTVIKALEGIISYHKL